MNKKPSERIKEIYKKISKQYPLNGEINVALNNIIAIVDFLDEKYEEEQGKKTIEEKQIDLIVERIRQENEKE